jgi:general secretion pathway protein G
MAARTSMAARDFQLRNEPDIRPHACLWLLSEVLPAFNGASKVQAASKSAAPIACPSAARSSYPSGLRRALPFLSARRSRGFTLIELMVVLVIIGVLAALIVPNVLERAEDARITAARVDVNNLMQALKLYKLDNQTYPTQEQGLDALVHKPAAGPIPPNWKPYVEKLPNDPWGRSYQYANPA